MTWTRLSDDFTDRPGIVQLSRSARLMHVEGLVWCNRHLTDGVLLTKVLPRISDSEDIEADVAELVAAGLWTKVDDRTWQIDWSNQEPAAQVEQRREDNAERQRKYKARRRRCASGDHAGCTNPEHCPALRAHGNAPANALRNGANNDPPTRPDPTRRGGEREGRGRLRLSRRLRWRSARRVGSTAQRAMARWAPTGCRRVRR